MKPEIKLISINDVGAIFEVLAKDMIRQEESDETLANMAMFSKMNVTPLEFSRKAAVAYDRLWERNMAEDNAMAEFKEHFGYEPSTDKAVDVQALLEKHWPAIEAVTGIAFPVISYSVLYSSAGTAVDIEGLAKRIDRKNWKEEFKKVFEVTDAQFENMIPFNYIFLNPARFTYEYEHTSQNSDLMEDVSRDMYPVFVAAHEAQHIHQYRSHELYPYEKDESKVIFKGELIDSAHSARNDDEYFANPYEADANTAGVKVIATISNKMMSHADSQESH